MTPTKEESTNKDSQLCKLYGFIAGTDLSLSLIDGLLSASTFRPHELVISDEHFEESSYKELLRSRGVNVVHMNEVLMNECAVVFLDVLPDVLKLTLKRFRKANPMMDCLVGKIPPLIVSLVTGISIQNLEELLSPLIYHPRVIRLLANTSCSIRQGCCAYAVGRYVLSEDLKFMENFSEIGICEIVLESKLDVLSAISVSIQSFIFSGIEAIADGGVKLGLHQNMALRFAVKTALGSAKMSRRKYGSPHPAIPRIRECAMSPSTSAAMHFLEKQSFRGSLMSAVEGAFLRTREDAQKEMSRPVDTFLLAVERNLPYEDFHAPFATNSPNGKITVD